MMPGADTWREVSAYKKPLLRARISVNAERTHTFGMVHVRQGEMFKTIMNLFDRTANDRAIIAKSPLFDSSYYISYTGEGHDINALEHFCRIGWRRGHNPSAFFNGRFYLDKYQDVRTSGRNPLVHYLRYGAAERRVPSPEFDVQDFIDHHPEAGLPGAVAAEICIRRLWPL